MAIWQRIADLFATVSDRTGAFAGSLAGLLDPDNWLPGGREAAFTLALVALAAKMAVADGVVTHSEERAFRQIVDVPPEAEQQVMGFFELAQQDVAGFRTYARKVARLFADSPESLEHVLDGLFHIAAADGVIHEAEQAYLADVSAIFGFDEVRFEQIAAQHIIQAADRDDPYLVLGLSPVATDSEVQKVYRGLVAEHHPDRLHAAGVPAELMGLATARMAAINAAYDAIAVARGLKVRAT